MDRVRFGKALGLGAREAGKALAKAADAAMAPDPRGAASSGGTGRRTGEAAGQASVRARAAVSEAKAAGAGVKRGGRRFGEAVWAPFVKVSGVLWLEVTGVFFGLFAVFAGIEVWKRCADFRHTGAARQHVWFAAAMLAVFGYFTLSSFVRAARRGKR